MIDFTPSLGWMDVLWGYPVEFPTEPHSTDFFLGNGFFEAVDAEILYGMLRAISPQRIVEVGSGYSTRVTAGIAPDHVAIDPAPRADLPESVWLHQWPVQSEPLETFDTLEPGDILFIDSDHRLTPGGAVEHLYLRVLPRLASGVVVHVHDIFLPDDYPARWSRRAYTEQTVLAAFLEGNADWEVLLSAHWLHANHPERLAVFPSYGPGVDPASFWMRRR